MNTVISHRQDVSVAIARLVGSEEGLCPYRLFSWLVG